MYIVILATATNGLLAGISFDATTVKLPARRRIGNIAYAIFARGNDLGNGLYVYPPLAIVSALLVFLATIITFFSRHSNPFFFLLVITSATSILHFIGTAKAAPVMLSIKNAPNDEKILKAKLDKFERWHAFRALFQIVTFFLLIWVLAVR